MTQNKPLYLERPAFWREWHDPEVWLRALVRLARAAETAPLTGSPRTLVDRHLSGVISRRNALGLFGAFEDQGRTRLAGVGLMVRDANGHWCLSDAARGLPAAWRQNPAKGLADFAALLVRESPWLRLLLLRLQQGDWRLANWTLTRAGGVGLRPGHSLLMHRYAAPQQWFAGLEHRAAAPWPARTGCTTLAYDPGLLKQKKRGDTLSLAPLTAPLHLLEAVGWLRPDGQLMLPGALAADLYGAASPAQTLARLTAEHADLRGFVAVEPLLRALLADFDVRPNAEVFARWMDRLIDLALSRGAVELLDAEPGQNRHGRGLHADPRRQRVRWVVHTEFNETFQSAWPALVKEREHTP